MSYEQIIGAAKQGEFSPVYLLMGEEPFFIDQITKVIEDGALSEDMRGFNQTITYGQDSNIEQIVSMAKSFPMMGDRQVIIIKEAQALSTKIQGLSAYCAQPMPSTILVICYKYKKVDKRTELVKNVSKTGVVFTSDKIRDYKVPQWIQGHCRSTGLTLSDKQAGLLSEFLGSDLSRIHTELQKLKSIVGDADITDDDIQKHVGISKEYNIYELQKAVLQRNFALTMRITDHYARNPKSMHIVPAISSLYNVFTRWLKLYYLKDRSKPSAQSGAGVTFFFYNDYMYALKAYSLKEVVQNIKTLKEYDLKAKGLGNSGSDPEGLFIEMMQRLVLK